MKQSKGYHLIIILVLGIVFFALLFMSTGQNNVIQTYDFKDEIVLNYIPAYNDFGDRTIVGTLKLENTGLLPSKVKLKRYVLCQISDTYGDRTYMIDYKGKVTNSYSDMIFGSGNSLSAEVSSKEVAEFEMVPQLYYYSIRDDIVNYGLNNHTLPFYLFEVENANYYDYVYDYCSGAAIGDAVKVINVKVELSEEDLNDGVVPKVVY